MSDCPGETKYWSQKGVERELVSRKLEDCLYDKSANSAEDNTDGVMKTAVRRKERRKSWQKLQSSDESSDETKGRLEVERRLFGVCESRLLMDMVERVNAVCKLETLVLS